MGRYVRLCIGLIVLLVAASQTSPLPAEEQAGEYQVKAAFIHNFIKYVEFPEGGERQAGTFQICVLGKNPFGEAFAPYVNKNIQGRKLLVKAIQRVEDAKGCQLLFISSSERRKVPLIMQGLQGLPILTVRDFDGFSAAGGMIELVPLRNRVGFIINLAVAKESRLKISSQLLKLAQRVIEYL
jgi:hypothetical protein